MGGYLKMIDEKCQLITVFKSNRIKEGYHKAEKMFPLYYLANHPGRIIYKTDYFHGLDKKKIEELVFAHESVGLLNYVTYELMLKLEKGYYYNKDIINQPKDRDKNVKQARKELR